MLKMTPNICQLFHGLKNVPQRFLPHTQGQGLLVIIGLFLSLLFVATPAWAVQSHGGAEGLVSHQIGHFLFIVGLVFLVFRLSFMHVQGQGWREFKVFLWLLILWNIVTFSGHLLDEFISPEKLVRSHGSTLYFVAENFLDVIFYITRLDHLVLVPSFVFLLVALRKWRAAQ